MKDLFERAYYGFIDAVVELTYNVQPLLYAMAFVLVCLTLPIWVIPYAIYKKWGQK